MSFYRRCIYRAIFSKPQQQQKKVNQTSNNPNTNSTHTDSNNSKYTQLNSNRHSLKYKWFIYEIFYLYKDVLKSLIKTTTTITKTEPDSLKTAHLDLSCKYLSEFLSLTTNSPLSLCSDPDELNNNQSFTTSNPHSPPSVLITPKSSIRSSKSLYDTKSRRAGANANTAADLELRLNRRFLDFLSKQAAKLYEYLCQLYPHSSHLPILVCSQLILFKTQHGEQINRILMIPTATTTSTSAVGMEAYLSKCLIDTIDKNAEQMLYGNYALVAILLDLYIKCGTFRGLLNECQHFHVYLVACLNKCFGISGAKKEEGEKEEEEEEERNEEIEDVVGEYGVEEVEVTSSLMGQVQTRYVEILFDLIFCYLYFNRKVRYKLFNEI